MANKTFLLTILTPFGQYYQGQASFISVKSNDFVIGILPNHAPLISTIDVSKLTIKDEVDHKTYYAVGEGAIRVKEDGEVILMVKTIESKEEIDLERAKKAKERAEERINSKAPDIDLVRAKAALYRAINRINVVDN